MRPVLRPQHPVPRSLGGLAAHLGTPCPAGAEAVQLTGLSMDSRGVVAGDCYAGVPGAQTHGATYAAAAAADGAVALLTDPAGARAAAGVGLPALVVDDPRAVVGEAAAWVYGEPSRDLLLLGVTGTNGKTTTTYLLDSVLREAYGESGLIGTVETRIGAGSGETRIPSTRTTPEAPEVQALLAVMRERGLRSCAMEVSSHALALGRVDGTVFDVVGFTNLSQDHLDFHGTMTDYLAAKAALFTPARARRGVVCVDDAAGRQVAAQASVPVTTVQTLVPYGGTRADGDDTATGGRPADWQVAWAQVVEQGQRTAFDLVQRDDGRRLRLVAPLPGGFNLANSALAAAMLLEAGVDEALVRVGLAGLDGVPGRMERVTAGAVDEPLALVDYAHTPDAVEAALRALRPSVSGRLWVVLGAGGDRDRGKRGRMGEVAARWADAVVVTDDNPRSERPEDIRRAVLDGVRTVPRNQRAEVHEEGDRRAAIRLAVDLAGSDDLVLVAGKGHEQGQEVDGVVHPFDDRVELRAALGHSPDHRADDRSIDGARR